MSNQKESDLMSLFRDPTYRIGESKNILTYMIRMIMMKMNLSYLNWFMVSERWLKRKFGAKKYTGDHNQKKLLSRIATHRGNLNKEIAGDNATIAVFQKFTQALGATKVTMTVKLEFEDGRRAVTVDAVYTNSTNEVDGLLEDEVQMDVTPGVAEAEMANPDGYEHLGRGRYEDIAEGRRPEGYVPKEPNHSA